MNNRESRNVFLQGIVTIAAAFLIGTFAMIYNNDKSVELFVKELGFLSSRVSELKEQIKLMQIQINANTLDRWTRTEHDMYDKDIQKRLNSIEQRLYKLEAKK